MALVRLRDTQQATIRQAVKEATSTVRSYEAIQEAIRRTGTPGETSLNGFYSVEGVFTPFLRLGLDAMDSGRGCAP